jgi:hypothetical protein
MRTKIFTFILMLLYTATSAQSTQTVKGRITDDASKSVLPGVNVILLNATTVVGTVTDVNGYFKLTKIPVGRQSFKISYLGYEDQVISNVLVTTGKEVELNVNLVEKVNKINEVEIVYKRSSDKISTNNEMSTVSSRSFNLEDTKKYAGALGDPSRMAANFAGVSGANDSRNDIVVRGNSPEGMLWQMEGLNIPNPNHFGALSSTGGPVSMLNNNNLDKSDFMTGAFPAQYGNATAGVFDLKLRNGNTDKSEFVGQIGFNGFEFGAEGPFSKKSKASYLVNYRYSTLGVFKAMGINFGTGSAIPDYQDVNYKVFIPLNAKSKLSIFGIAGNSKVNFLGNEVDTTQTDLYGSENTNTKVKYATSITGVTFDHQLNSKINIKITAGLTTTAEQFNGDSISYITREEFPSGESKLTTNKWSANAIVSYKINAKNTLQFGMMNDLLQFDLYNARIVNGNIKNVRVDIEDENYLMQAYAQWKHRFTQKLSINTGIHNQYHSLSKATSVEPRVGLKYLVDARSSLSFAYGLHAQAQNIYSYYVITPTPNGIVYTNKDLDFTYSNHYVLAYDLSITEYTRIKVESYYQSLYNIPVTQNSSSFSAANIGSDFAPSNVDSLVNNGNATNIGVELTLERFFNKGFYYLLTTSVFDSKYKGSDGIERNTAFNTNYVVNALLGKEFKLGTKGDVLTLNLKVTQSGGRYLTPIDFAASSIAKEAVYDNDRAYSERQDPYFRTDFKFSYRKEMKKSTMEFAVDFQNLTNNKNVFRQSYNPETNSIVTEYQQGFFPVPMFRMTF